MQQVLSVKVLVCSICAACCSIGSAATQVIKDHVSDAAAWDDDGGGLLDHFIDPDAGWSGVAAIAITGNGQQLDKVGVIWAQASVAGEPNAGDIHELRWRFRFFPDTASFSLSAMYSPAPHPNWQALFNAPSNPGWTNVIGSFLGIFDLRYAEVDVRSLHIATTPGQTHLVVLVPESRLTAPATIASIAMSDGGDSTIGTESDWYERGALLGAEGPGSLASLAENWSYVAGRVDTVAEPQTIYVSTSGDDGNNGLSWGSAKRTVQAGLNIAGDGDQVWVAAGTYVENISLVPGVALYGGFGGDENPISFNLASRDLQAHPTILNGNQAGAVVSCPPGATTATRIDGFTITNGRSPWGGGLYLWNSSPTVANNIITGNSGYEGGGVYLSDSSPTIAGNTITGNSGYSGGGLCLFSSSPTITHNTITGNTASTWGEYAGSGGGIYAAYFSSPTIVNCTIARNTSTDGGGGLYLYSSSPILVNSTITGNRAVYYGGGLYLTLSSPTMANCTIAGNEAGQGGGACLFGSSPTIANTIAAFNSSGIYYGGPGTPVLRYNCVYGNTGYNYFNLSDPTGTDGNISADPLFRAASSGADHTWGTADDTFSDLRPAAGSPCIDAADNGDVPADITDLDGDGNTSEPLPTDLAGWARFIDDPATLDTGAGTPPMVDMGAYEFHLTAPADFNDDGHVDNLDLNIFKACATGSAVPYNAGTLPEASPGCTLIPDGAGKIAADFDQDTDVDMEDFGVFQRCYSGSSSLANPDCGG